MDTQRDTNGTTGDAATPGINHKSQYALREELYKMARRDLLGPVGGEDEEIDEEGVRVSVRYLVGMLAPRHQQDTAGKGDDDDDPDEGGSPEDASAHLPDDIPSAGVDSPEDGAADRTPVLANTLFPSSFGMTFTVDGSARKLKVHAEWGQYDRTESEYLMTETGKAKIVYKRRPVRGTTIVDLVAGDLEPWAVSDEFPEVRVQGRVRQSDGDWVVTLFLVNGQRETKRLKDERWLFQPKLAVEAVDGSAVFEKRLSPLKAASQAPESIREEMQELAMLYRRNVEFARGHGVSVHATPAADDPQRAVRIETEVIPTYQVPLTETPTVDDNPDLSEVVLDMKVLAEADTTQLVEMLGLLADAYDKWIDREESKVDNPEERLAEFAEVARRNTGKCRRALERIREGIRVVEANPLAADALRFANKVMWQQRVRSIYAQKRRQGDKDIKPADVDIPKNRSWRTFQLAFILLSLASTTDPHHHDRSHEAEAVADVIWFPTGGGKTEAYLGLAAYAMAYRRLVGEIGGYEGRDGLCVLMRYTLRLLTIQQFQRATALICACEVERRSDQEKWGEEPFRIGLWVGGKATPNYTKDAHKVIHALKAGGYPPDGVGTPAQLTACPWCGTPIDPKQHIDVFAGAKERDRTVIYCGDTLGMCPFSKRKSPLEGIPALVVDQEIYRNPPSLLIATVDKFAQMPWNGRTQMLFGKVDGRCPRHGYTCPDTDACKYHQKTPTLPETHLEACKPLRPPDLIIQDELHLINGPLGSMVGLYETAIDELSSWELDGRRVRPKVVASSATIRRARDQVKKLYLRDVEVFPPQGTEIRDNFFAVQREPSEDKPGRMYLGICSSGKRLPASLIRVYVALMGAAKHLLELYGEAADPWMTTVGYFNSIREMGGTRRLVEDDISSRLRRASRRGLADRWPIRVDELTSRRSSDQIPKILDRLEKKFKPGRPKAVGGELPLDVVLATNMISVGVDVGRLGLMIATSQPKTTAEYIQATSRVGRAAPGVVCTVYNWARPRDLSHFESFEHFHSTFYGHVEALSVTPFAPRALDRGLAGVLTSMVRLASSELNANISAGQLEPDHPLLVDAVRRIIARVEQVMVGDEQLLSELKRMLDAKTGQWEQRAVEITEGDLHYRQSGTSLHLLEQPEPGTWEEFTCLNSLREVEPTVNLLLVNEDAGLEPVATANETEGDSTDE